jgi:hypothetical protein
MALLTFKVVRRLLTKSFIACWLENIEFVHIVQHLTSANRFLHFVFLFLVCFLVISLFTIHTLQLELFVVFQTSLLPFKIFCSFNHTVHFL